MLYENNISLINKKTITKDYKINFSKIIKKLKLKSDNDCDKYFIKYVCNFCLLQKNIEIANKVNFLTLSSYIEYQNEKNINYILKIIKIIIKLMNKENQIENFIWIRNLYRASDILFINNDYFNSYYYVKVIKTLKKDKMGSKSEELLNDLNKKLEEKINEYVNIYQIKYYNNEIDINSLITIFEKKLNPEISSDDIICLINKKWVEKAKKFLLQYQSNTNNNKIFQFFNIKEIIKNYFNDLNEENFNIFPGPINNYNLLDFKDSWYDPDENFIHDNYYLKEDIKINIDFYTIKKKYYDLIVYSFGHTNLITKKNNDIYLKQIKCIVFDKRMQDERFDLIKFKYFQISNFLTVKDFKLKILRCLNYQLENENKNITQNDILNYKKIKFYLLDKAYKNILSEIIIAFKNKINKFEFDFKKIKINNEMLMKDFPYINNKESNSFLLIEVVDKNEKTPPFLNLLSYNCSECGEKINENNLFICDKCNYFFFCSKECASKNRNHQNIDKILEDIYINPFNIHKLYNSDLDNFLINKNGYNNNINNNDNNNINNIENNNNNNNDKILLGRKGLKNLGNTCYLNSTIQCLSNTIDLTKYFFSNYYEQEINYGSKFSLNGKLVEVYVELLRNLWHYSQNQTNNFEFIDYDNDNNNNNMYCTPIRFKNFIFQHFPQFNGFLQQDSHEFLSIFLESLHEELNRITNKPYVELKERQNDEDDNMASKRWWENFKKRDDSIIVDLFYGQLKSLIKCPNCQKESISYEPFMILNLNIPETNKIKIKLLYKNICTKINCSINQKTTLKEIKETALLSEILINNNIKDINLLEAVCFDKEKMIKNIIQNDRTLIYKKISKEKEIILYVKDNLNGFNIYVYPVSIKIEKSFFGLNKKYNFDFLSYPLSIFVNYNTKICELYNMIADSTIQSVKSEKDQYDLQSYNFFVYHNLYSKTNLKNFFTKFNCELCGGKNKEFCSIKDINDYIGNIYDKYKNKRPFIMLVANKDFDITKPFFANLLNLLERQITNQSLIEKNSTINIYDCLNYYNQIEQLGENDQWYCSTCKSYQQAIKKTEIYTPPNYLIIQLKRFKMGNNKLNKKNDTFVDFPLYDLDLRRYIIGPDKNNALYDIYGIIYHLGNGINTGHYIAVCKNNNDWICYNDINVKIFYDEKNLIDKSAYLLFYKKKNLE